MFPKLIVLGYANSHERTSKPMHAMANMALRAPRRAGDILLQSMDRLDELKVEEKAPNDFVSNVQVRRIPSQERERFPECH